MAAGSRVLRQTLSKIPGPTDLGQIRRHVPRKGHTHPKGLYGRPVHGAFGLIYSAITYSYDIKFA